jgi:NhaP-type Na+/H+ and K+/H+ antiporter
MYKITRLVCLFILVAIMLVMPTARVSAAMVRCRTDPIFMLSNGDVINVTLDISTHAAYVINITYVLHLPAGVTVKRVAYTAVNLRIHEMYHVYQDSPAKPIPSILR